MKIARSVLGRLSIGLAVPQSLVVLILCSILPFRNVATGQPERGPSYAAEGRACDYHDQCAADKGEVCWWYYDGCAKGACVCDPRRYTPGPDGTCLPIRDGNDSCNIDLVCPMGMSCQGGTCQCKLGEMTPDRKFCKQAYHKMLGEECSPFDNTCVQINSALGYTSNEVGCDYRLGECTCLDGFKQDGLACRRRNIGEKGCSSDFHCQGGAVCSRQICVCPAGYKAVADNTKCAPVKANANLHIGQPCDEYNERTYCAFGLVCHVCGGEAAAKCVRYESYEERSTSGGSGSGSRVSGSLRNTSPDLLYIMLLQIIMTVVQMPFQR